MEEEIKKQKLPKTNLDFIKFMKKQWIFALALSAILVFYFKFLIAPNYIRDFFVIALFNAVDMYTTFFALNYIPKTGEANPITRDGFEKTGYIRTYITGLVYISFLILLMHIYTMLFTRNTAMLYSFGMFGMYALVGQQPFMNLRIIINNKMKGKTMKSTYKLKKTFTFACVLTSIMLGLASVLIFVLFMITGRLWVTEVLNIVLLLTLVTLTGIYASITSAILNETQKDRKIKYLEKRLEKFYSPLLNNRVFWTENYAGFQQFAFKDIPNSEEAKQMKDFLDTCKTYSHFATSPLEPFLKEFNGILKWGDVADMTDEDFLDFKNRFKEELRKQYEAYKNELSEIR